LPGIAFRVLVGQLRALRLHHRPGNIIFRGDQLDVIFLAAVFLLDGGKQFGIGLGEGALLGKHFWALGKMFQEGPTLRCAATKTGLATSTSNDGGKERF
jgi:hypothetical protein